MLATEELALQQFAVQTVHNYLFSQNSGENRARILKEIAVCNNDWDEICKRTLMSALVYVLDIEPIFFEVRLDMMSVILDSETIEAAIIVLAVNNFPDWDNSIRRQLELIIAKIVPPG
jgi:hypothetical protein